jgi:hypothetical protein
MQDGTQEGNEAYVISHRGARSRGYKRRERARARARERESPGVLPVLCAPRPYVPLVDVLRPPISMSTSLRKALDIPFYRYREMPSCTMGCSYALTWLAEKRLEPCTRANVAIGEAPCAL